MSARPDLGDAEHDKDDCDQQRNCDRTFQRVEINQNSTDHFDTAAKQLPDEARPLAIFVLVPMAQALFQAAAIPKRLIPATIALGTSTFTMSALPGTPAIQNAIPMPFFGTTLFAAPGLGIIASAIMLGFGLWWLGRREASARRAGEGYGSASDVAPAAAVEDELVRERATTAREFDGGLGRPAR